MNINQHNCEEFFLLYVDGELSMAEKQAVEQFVQANPEFANELTILQQVKLPSDAVMFNDKEVLYRNTSAGMGTDNYEDYFLLYVDDELDAEAKEQVERFVLQHPALQETFTILKQTKLATEPVRFPNKQLLYRKEKKASPVFYMHWRKIAIAAGFIGLALLAGIWFSGNRQITEQTLATQLPSNNEATQASNETQQKNNRNARKEADKAVGNTVIAANKTNRFLQVAKNNAPKKLPENIPVDTGKNLIARKKVPPEIITAQPETTIVDNTLIESPAHALQTPPTSLMASGMVNVKNKTAMNPASDDIVRPAIYKELDTENEKKSLYVGSIEINKNKLRGFFRKAAGFLLGKLKQQDEDDKTEDKPFSSNTQ